MANWILFVSVFGAFSFRISLSHPLPNTDVNARDSLPNLLASVLSAGNGRTLITGPPNQVQHGQRQVIISKTEPNYFIHRTAFQRNPESHFLNTGQHGSSIRQGIFNKIKEDSMESLEEFQVLRRKEPIKKTPTKNSDAISSKPVYFDQTSFNSVRSKPKRMFQQQSSPNELPLFLVLRNDGHSTNNKFLSNNPKVTSIQGSYDNKLSESDLSLFLPIIFGDNENKKPEFRRLSIPRKFQPGFEHLSNHEPKELADNLHGYVLDINEKDSHKLISFLKQSSLESLESRGRSSSSEEDYSQGVTNFRSRNTYEDSSADSDEVHFENNFREAYSEEDIGGEKNSAESKDIMIHPITNRKNQGSFTGSRTLYLGAPVITSTHPHHSPTAPTHIRDKGRYASQFKLKNGNSYPSISSEETLYEKNHGFENTFQVPRFANKVPKQEPNYDPLSSTRGLSQTLSSLFIKRIPKITTFPSSSHSMKSTGSGLSSGSIRLIPSTLYNNEGANQGITGVLGLGQPVSVGLLQ